MKQLKTARLQTSLRKILLALAAGLVIFAGQAAAQEAETVQDKETVQVKEKLGDLMSETGFDWIVGKWVAQTEEGQKYEIAYKWELNKHAITVQLKRGDYEHHSMIFYLASEDKIVEIGADNKGGTTKGTWEVEGDKAIHKMEHTPADGKTGKIGIIYSKTDVGTMRAEAHMLNDTGELGEEPWGVLEYKPQKEQTGKKCCG
ncbi:MAG: hypothetical protein ACYS9C_03945 [Planctomycetota bacterium]|jgi:hypothetical protein